MKFLSIVAVITLTFALSSCKSGDKCGDCPTFSKQVNDTNKKQV